MDLGNINISEDEINAGSISIPLIKGDKGDKGNTGATGNGIVNIFKTGTSGLVDTYTITYTNGTTKTFEVTNGSGITNIEKTDTTGLVDTYTITYANGTTSTFDVTNGYTPVRGTDYWTEEDKAEIVESVQEELADALDLKVDKVAGKGLSTEDYTTAEKSKLSGIETGAKVNIIETIKVNNTPLTPTNKAVNITVPTKVSDLTDDSGHYTKPSGGIPKTDLTESVQASLGKADTALQEHQSLTGYVKNTDYATSSKSGVIKTSGDVGTQGNTTTGVISAATKTYEQYQSALNNLFIGKGTLEAVITGKELTNKTYVDNLVGDIESILEELDIGGGI